jgi:hypothetical protein
MNDRSAALDAAVRAQGKLIAEAQRLLKAYVESKRVHPDAVITICSGFSTGPASARRNVWCARRWARISPTMLDETGRSHPLTTPRRNNSDGAGFVLGPTRSLSPPNLRRGFKAEATR